MRVVLRRIDEDFHLQAENETGKTVEMDGSPTIGGHDLGVRPMELLLSALGGCSAMDVLHILRKQRQTVQELKITVDGDRVDGTPAVFRRIKIHFELTGQIDREKAARAIELSMGTYCSVTKMLEKTAQITHSFAVNGV